MSTAKERADERRRDPGQKPNFIGGMGMVRSSDLTPTSQWYEEMVEAAQPVVEPKDRALIVHALEAVVKALRELNEYCLGRLRKP